jgi:hypothetical protein
MLKTYKLTSDFSRTEFYASKEWGRLEENFVEHRRLGHFVALTGPVGVGKTTLIHGCEAANSGTVHSVRSAVWFRWAAPVDEALEGSKENPCGRRTPCRFTQTPHSSKPHDALHQ